MNSIYHKLTIACFLAMIGIAHGQQMPYQGRLTDSTGAPLPGPQATLHFSFWISPTGGSPSWGEWAVNADLIDGRFSVKLGDAIGRDDLGRSLRDVLSAFGELFIQIRVGTDDPLPRQQVLPAPTAISSYNAISLRSPSALVATVENGNLEVSKKTLIHDHSTGPATNGTLGGNGTRLVLWPGSPTQTPYAMGIDHSTLWFGSPSRMRWYNGTAHNMTLSAEGDLGIGTGDSPGADLHVQRPDNDVARVYATGSSAGGGMFYAGESVTHGGGILYEGDGNPNQAGADDRIVFFRRNGGADERVMSYSRASNNLDLYGRLWVRETPAATAIAAFGSPTVVQIVDNDHFNVANGNLQVTGTAGKTGGGTSWINLSDRRLKKDIRPFDRGLDEIMELNPVHFRYKDNAELGLDSNHDNVGFIAQDVRQSIPEAVSGDETITGKHLTLNADPIHWAAINAIKELKAQKDEEIDRLQKQNDALASRLRRAGIYNRSPRPLINASSCRPHGISDFSIAPTSGRFPGISPMSYKSSKASKVASFPTTRWSLVLQVSEGPAEESKMALEELCSTYWYPIYAYLRRRGSSHSDAEDLTQGFFARLLERQTFTRAQVDRGKLRTFLLTDLKHFHADETRRATALKRGGDHTFIPIDAEDVERRYEESLRGSEDPESLYQRAWAGTLIDRITKQLKKEYESTGNGDVFDLIGDHLYGKNSDLPYEEMAGQLKSSINAARLTVFRMRQRFRALLETEISHTVESPSDVNAEIDFLLSVVSRGVAR